MSKARSIAIEMDKYGIKIGDAVTVNAGYAAGHAGKVTKVDKATGFVAAFVLLEAGELVLCGLDELTKQ